MAVKKITRKVISKKVTSEKEVEKPIKAVKAEEASEQVSKEYSKETRAKKVCLFCQSKTSPSYTDTNVLRKFTSDRSNIVPRAKSGLCAKHQRAVTRQIKYARHLSLLPFTPKV